MDKKQHSKSTASGSSSSSTTNKPKKISSSSSSSSSTAASVSTMGRSAALPQPARRIIQNFLLVWLDANVDESKEDFQNSLKHLRRIVASITTFTDAQQCFDYLSGITKEKAFMIVSGSLGQKFVPEMEAMPQLESVYVFCGNQSYHEQWANKVSKIKGVYTKIEPICKALEIDRQRCDQAMISISFNGLDALFMYTQLLKEAVLEIEDDDKKSMKDLVTYCREQKDISEDQIKLIEREYRDHTPIWWYTAPYFMYSMLNRGLRQMDVDIILKMGFFIRHLHQHIQNLYHKQQSENMNTATPFKVYRGQGLALEDFEKTKKSIDQLMSFNNFLSTSLNQNISFENFARPAAFNDPNKVGILFIMTIDPDVCTKSKIPFADVSQVSFFEDQEAEILFTTHTIFRIDQIQRIHDDHTDRLWEVHLTLVGNDNHELNTLTAHVREEINLKAPIRGWSQLAFILIKVGEPAKAKKLYKILLQKATSDEERSDYYHKLGWAYDDMGEYSKALSSYEQSLEIKKIALPPNHPSLATSYNNIASVYNNMGEYLKALSSYEQSLEIRKIALPPNHPNIAQSYNNIGSVYYSIGEYSKALSSHERALEIKKIALPPNHPDLASSYNNIGMVYDEMGEYSKALSSYERALDIDKKVLPPNHPDLASDYLNIGNVYDNMGEYSKALSSYERSLEIHKIALPPNHPDMASDYNNIGMVYDETGEYSKALSSYERSLEIRKIALPPNHPDLAASYNNIGNVYNNMDEYSKALISHERSLEIKKTALPPNHPDLAISYNNIGSLYDNMGEYSKSLSYYEKALQIKKIALPSAHPSTALTERNIERVKKKM
ncbi:unnamed protein product [Rotaria sordida]|uniref:ADP ribosyltransferase domain-containing protein n=1 Tax=Rotaria sordida TaxID=392033 RepID=A0A815LBF7_9BILA|nr:unnamed protein product [Rotaria sordida]